MKYGLLVNRSCRNLGDDIQSYAESLFLPKVDYMVDREYISDFKPKKDDEVVATIMGAWWTRHKWNFPPAKNIYPLWTSIHLTQLPPEWTGTPIYDEIFHGVGGEHLRAYGPVGTRDMDTLKALESLDIPAFFSGCTTLTLPKQKKVKLDKEYILLVDVDPRVEKKIKSQLKNADIEIKITSNQRSTKRTEEQMDSWEFRKNEIEDLLGLYQNAKCVITRRLHVALPCLAMEVPVFVVHNPKNARFNPYSKWLHMVSPESFLKGNYDYDFLNPKDNKKDYLKYRESLTKQMSEFVKTAGKDNRPLKDVILTSYTDDDVMRWQHGLMKLALDRWTSSSNAMSKRLVRIRQNQSAIYKTSQPKLDGIDNTVGKIQDEVVKHNEKIVKDYLNANKSIRRQVYVRARSHAGKALRRAGLKK